jgi:hypothetical protein
MFIVHRKREEAEGASRILGPLLSAYHLWCDWMSVVRERWCFGELKVACSPPGGDRRLGGWLPARPVAVAAIPHCWSWFIPFSIPPRTPPPSMSRAIACCTVFSRATSRRDGFRVFLVYMEESRNDSVRLEDPGSIPSKSRIFSSFAASIVIDFDYYFHGGKVGGSWSW